MDLLSLGVMGRSLKENERRLPLHPHHLERLPVQLRDGFTLELTNRAAGDDPPFTLDYRRLNIDARRPDA